MKLKRADLHKICIYGGSGSGKSSLAIHLGSILQIEPTHIDDLFWLENWHMKSRENLINDINKVLEKPYWIIDGNYSYVSRNVMWEANTIIIIHISIWIAIWRLILRRIGRRYTFNFIKVTPLPKNVRTIKEPEHLLSTICTLAKQTFKFYLIRYKFYYTQALSIKPAKKIVIFKNSKQITKFLQLLDF